MIQTAKNDPHANVGDPGKNRSPALQVNSLPFLFLLTVGVKRRKIDYQLKVNKN